uniref:BgtE-20050 n=1 Tax=Blumeria graminis f. sp. tritici 96224 TaxID=1268274 RepID=A0A381LD60_BLUGR
MKFINVTLITTTISLFTSFVAAQNSEDFILFACIGVDFYKKSVQDSAAKSHRLGRETINGYPTFYNLRGLPGSRPHKLFPMIPNIHVYNGGKQNLNPNLYFY